MAKRFTADPHHMHARIQIYCPERAKFGDINQQSKELSTRWNDVVDDGDDVWVLGDYYFGHDLGKLAAITRKLKGHKHLIIGNHDQLPWYEYVKAGFETVQRYAVIHIDGVGPVALAHDPSGSICMPTIPWLVGHLHQQFVRMGNCINVGVDVRNFTPISETELAEDFRITKIHMKIDPYAEKEILGKE